MPKEHIPFELTEQEDVFLEFYQCNQTARGHLVYRDNLKSAQAKTPDTNTFNLQ